MTDAVLNQSPFQVTIWQPGHTYYPGDVVQPTTTTNAGTSPPTNADFVASLTGWTASANVTWASTPSYNANGGSAQVAAGHMSETIVNNNQVAVTVGQTINASFYAGGNSGISLLDNVIVTPELLWYDATHALIKTTRGTPQNAGQLIPILGWVQLNVGGAAPTGAAYCAVGCSIDNPSSDIVYIDAFYWDYIVPSANTTAGTVAYFTSISAAAAVSGSAEPDWTNGGSNTGNVVDGGITWARGTQEVIQWTCVNFCHSWTVEPTWGLTAGSSTPDGHLIYDNVNVNAFDWIAQTPQIQDSNCPQSRYVAIGASHIFAGDNDITRFCAVINPTDWTSEGDAGFLATGLQNYGSTPVTALELYRSNLVVFNAESCQMWQIDQDPSLMSLLDVIPIGCTWPKALTSVNDDLFFLSSQGVRSATNAIGTANLVSGDVGMPMDPVIQAGMVWATANNVQPMAIYYPSAGQFWIVFPGWNASSDATKFGTFFYPQTGAYLTGDSIFVYTKAKTGDIGAWSRYAVPFVVESWCIHSGDLYIHTASGDVLKVDPTALQDYAGSGSASNFNGVVQWPWLDFGQTGTTKKFDTMDIAMSDSTAVMVQLGFDQSNMAAFTDPFQMPADSFPGMQIPIPIMAPSLSVRLIFSSADSWQIDAVNVYLQDQAVTS